MATVVVDEDVAGRVGVGPVVLVGGRPWSAVWVRRVSATGPSDRREAELVLRREAGGWSETERDRLRRLSGEAVTIAEPMAVSGGESRLMVLMHGRLGAVNQRLDGQRDELTITARCGWSHELEQRLRRGDLRGASRWTVGQLVERLNDVLGLRLSVGLLEREVREATVPSGVATASEAGAMLTALCGRYGLTVRRTLTWRGHGVIERRELRSVRRGRAVRLRRGAVATAGGVAALTASVVEPRPTRLVAEASGQVVERTFELMPGWGGTPLDLDDSAYGKSTSEDFDAVANAFRLWVLNEDGAFEGERFDLRALFGEDRAVPREPLRFGEALTRDGAGRSLGVVVETSVDAGQTWSRHGGPTAVLDDRAGVYLDDDAPAEAWLTAVRHGEARVRVTATLRNVLPMRAERWHGNAFAGAFVEQRHGLGEMFAYRRVSAESKYHEAVRSGERTADEADERAAMSAWLSEQAQGVAQGPGRVRLRTTGLMLGLSVGDRLTHIGEQAVGSTGSSGRVGEGVGVAEVEHRWDLNGTWVTVGDG